MRALDLGMRGGETAGPVAARTPRNSGFFMACGLCEMRALGVGVRRGETAGPVSARRSRNAAFFGRSVRNAGMGPGVRGGKTAVYNTC